METVFLKAGQKLTTTLCSVAPWQQVDKQHIKHRPGAAEGLPGRWRADSVPGGRPSRAYFSGTEFMGWVNSWMEEVKGERNTELVKEGGWGSMVTREKCLMPRKCAGQVRRRISNVLRCHFLMIPFLLYSCQKTLPFLLRKDYFQAEAIDPVYVKQMIEQRYFRDTRHISV